MEIDMNNTAGVWGTNIRLDFSALTNQIFKCMINCGLADLVGDYMSQL